MITMKLPFSVPDKDALRFKLLVANMRREQSIVIRSAYKRYNDGMNEKEIRAYLKLWSHRAQRIIRNMGGHS